MQAMNPTRSILVIAAIVAAGALALLPVNALTTPPTAKPKTKAKSESKKPNPGSEKAIRAFMRKKLHSMRQVMHGIVTEDYQRVRKNALAMKKMGTSHRMEHCSRPDLRQPPGSFSTLG